MDLAVTKFALTKMLIKKEKPVESNEAYAAHSLESVDGTSSAESTTTIKTSTIDSGFSYFLSLLIGFFAVYLSWRCNTAADMHALEKVLWAFLSFIFSIPFLIYYILIRSHECVPLMVEYKKKMRN